MRSLDGKLLAGIGMIGIANWLANALVTSVFLSRVQATNKVAMHNIETSLFKVLFYKTICLFIATSVLAAVKA